MKYIQLTFFAASFLFIGNACSATIYKCKSPQGELLYQEKPCAEETKSLSSWSVANEPKALENEEESSSSTLLLGQGSNGHFL